MKKWETNRWVVTETEYGELSSVFSFFSLLKQMKMINCVCYLTLALIIKTFRQKFLPFHSKWMFEFFTYNNTIHTIYYFSLAADEQPTDLNFISFFLLSFLGSISVFILLFLRIDGYHKEKWFRNFAVGWSDTAIERRFHTIVLDAKVSQNSSVGVLILFCTVLKSEPMCETSLISQNPKRTRQNQCFKY